MSEKEKILSREEFLGADYYHCGGDEEHELDQTTVKGAIMDYYEVICDWEEEDGDIVVWAYKRQPLSSPEVLADISDVALQAQIEIDNYIAESDVIGGSGYSDAVFSEAGLAMLRYGLESLITHVLRQEGTIYYCKCIGSRSFKPDEVNAITKGEVIP